MDTKKIFPGLSETDPEFAQIFTSFAFGEVLDTTEPMDEPTRYLAILATMLGCQGLDAFRLMLPLALDGGLTPIEVKETVYQAAAYLGLGRMLPFLGAVNEELGRRGVDLGAPGDCAARTSP